MRPPAGFSIPFPSTRPRGHPAPQPAAPWDVPRHGPRPQRFRVGGIAGSREAAGAHCAPLRKDGYPMRGTVQARRTKNRYPARRADDIRPHEKRVSGVGNGAYPPPRKTETRYRGRNVSARRAVFRLPRRGRSQTGPPGPGFPPLRPRRGGPRGRPPGSVYLSLRPVSTACGPLGRTPARAAAPAFPRRRGTRAAAKPRAHTVRPYDKTGTRRGGRIISAPTTKRVPNTAGG